MNDEVPLAAQRVKRDEAEHFRADQSHWALSDMLPKTQTIVKR